MLNSFIFNSEVIIASANNYSYGRKVDMIVTSHTRKPLMKCLTMNGKRSSCSQPTSLKQQRKNVMSSAAILANILKKVNGINSLISIDYRLVKC